RQRIFLGCCRLARRKGMREVQQTLKKERAVAKSDIEIRTRDGTAKAMLVQPSSPGGGKAGVILYMDAFGPRASLHGMAERLAGEGYAVLVPDLFYRFGAYGPFDAKTAFATEE